MYLTRTLSRKVALASLLLALPLVAAGTAKAATAPLLPGTPAPGILPPDDTGTALGTLLGSISSVVTAPTFAGTIKSSVYQSGGLLNFYYQVTETTGPDPIERLSVGGFGGFTTSVGFVTNGGSAAFAGTGFINGTQTTDGITRTPSGEGISVNFDTAVNQISPGQTSLVYVVKTNATAFTQSLGSVQDGTAANGNVFRPTAAGVVPEPGTIAMIGSGLLSMVAAGGIRRKRAS